MNHHRHPTTHRSRLRRSRRLTLAPLASAVTVAILAFSPAPASAHSEPVSSDPADGATLTADPALITLTLNQDIVANFAQVTFTTPDGTIHPPTPHVRGRTVTTTTSASHDGALAGQHRLAYRVVSDDGHPISGDLTYIVTRTTTSIATRAPASGAGASDGSSAMLNVVTVLLFAPLVVRPLLVLVSARRRRAAEPRNPTPSAATGEAP